MAQGLSVSRLVSVTINMSPKAPARRGFGTLLIIGDSNVIDVNERLRSYTGIEAVATDFGVNAPEYLAAQLYFGQTPKPRSLMIGRWARTATAGFLRGGVLTDAEQLMSAWTVITNGALKLDVDGATKTLTALDFSAQTNLNGVANIIDTAMSGATVTWNGKSFVVTSDTTGASSTVAFAQVSAGTDLGPLMKLTQALAFTPVNGVAAETPLANVNLLANLSSMWYGVMFAAATMPSNTELVAVAGAVNAFTITRVFGAVETDVRVLDASYSNDLASLLKALNYRRAVTQYSANKYAIASFFGRAFAVNFNANRSTITMMFKQEPGVVAEFLSETQAQTLETKRCNVFVNYDNDTAIVQYGQMADGGYFDEVHGVDWLANAVQNNIYTLLYTSKTKIPQTDAGSNQLVNEANSACEEGVNNGLLGPGTWNTDGFGQLQQGDYLKSGYYTFIEPIANQAQSERETRRAPPIQIAAKLAGAFHGADVILNVNR